MVSSPKAGPARARNVVGNGTRAQPWMLKTPGGQSEFTAYRDDAAGPPALVVQVAEVEHNAKNNRMRRK
jgi:hypothetical protein